MKKILIGIMLIFAAGTLCACGSKEQPSEADKQEVYDKESATASDIAEEILSKAQFKDKLASIDNSIALSRLYGLEEDKIEDAAFYTNSQATAEEIAVIKVSDTDYTDTVKEAYSNRIEEQKKACRDYLPDEIPKLETAVITQKDDYVILCISDDNEAAQGVVEAALK